MRPRHRRASPGITRPRRKTEGYLAGGATPSTGVPLSTPPVSPIDILERITDAFYALDRVWVFTYLNPEAERLLKRPRHELLGAMIWDVYDDVVGTPLEHAFRQAMRTHRTETLEFFYPPLDTWFEVRVYPSDDGLSVYFRDIGEAHRIAERLALSEALHRSLIEDTPGVIYSTAGDFDAPLRYVSPFIERLTGLPAATLLADPSLWMASIVPGDRERMMVEFARADAERAPLAAEYRIQSSSGETIWVQDDAWPVIDSEGTFHGWQGIVRDVSQIKRTERELHFLTYHDRLTGLRNRAALDEHLLELGQPGAAPAGVLFMDLDRFKRVNDAFGHDAGDDVLAQAADRLRAVVGHRGSVFRFGGDEFVVSLPGVPLDETVAIAERLIQVFEQPFRTGPHDVTLGASIGVTMTEVSGEKTLEILRRAGAALHVAKTEGRGRARVYAPEADRAPEELRLLDELRRGLERGELRLHYQPIVGTHDRRTMTVEALLRWQHPERGLLTPGPFIPLAEETGLVVPIGAWVLDEALRQVAAWDAELGPHAPPVVNVNLAARQLQEPDFCDALRETLARHGVAPGRLCFEISERTAIEDLASASETIAELHRIGVPLALDDFGAGTSSLALLHALRVRAIKLDAGFIQRLPTSAWDRMVVEGMTRLAHDLDVVVTAEGVETDAHLAASRAAGCDYLQGYFLARPMAAACLAHWLASARPGAAIA
jgi:diguanylate cyclase (GGDEF)-like protein/PAS domain S-box-containing protein